MWERHNLPSFPEKEDHPMGKRSGKYADSGSTPRKSHAGLIVGLILVFFLLCAIVLMLRPENTFQAALDTTPPTQPAVQTVSTAPASTEPETVPADTPVVTPTGDKAGITCKASYTVTPGAANASEIVATAGDRKLTNGMLQILYLSQVNAYRAEGAELAPDFSRPLDCQSCPLEEGLSWQHYFLKKAICSWQAQQAVLVRASQPQIITEEGFRPNYPNEAVHEINISPDLPVNNFLYQDTPCYTPNKLHRAYLDSMEQTLDTLASGAGFDSLRDMAGRLEVSADDFLQAALDYNTAYMYFTEKSYDFSPSDEEIRSYLTQHEAELSGSTETVDIRHILLIPEGAQAAQDGTITATDDQWSQAQQKAADMIAEWNATSPRQKKDAAFSQLATTWSQDSASRNNGGCYYGLLPGMLSEPLNEWCFSPQRKAGDHVILRNDHGVHILYFSGHGETGTVAAKNALVTQGERELWSQWLEETPLTPDYSAMALWADTTTAAVTLEDALYPDIAHERFPEAIAYLQQDYNYYPFGSGYIGSNGCGITAYAMLATYMTDSLQTPAMMADRFSQDFFDYIGKSVDGVIFRYGPSQMGFYLDSVTFDINDVISALKNGQVAICLQSPGHFTSRGHYLLLMEYYPEDDSIQLRDSNIYNYSRLRGHRVDRFSREVVAENGIQYYILQRKITAIPACCRCGSGDAEFSALLTQDYTCEKCVAALERRNSFLALLEALSH